MREDFLQRQVGIEHRQGAAQALRQALAALQYFNMLNREQ